MTTSPEQGDPGENARFSILLIDDNPGIHEDFRRILRSVDKESDGMEEDEAILFGAPASGPAQVQFELHSAMQGQEGLAKVRQAAAQGCPYAMAFVDVRMPPGWDGIETVRKIWEEFPDLQVVICAAYSDYSWQDIRAQLGDGDNVVILKKPFDHVEVLQLAHMLIKKWINAARTSDRIGELDGMVKKRNSELREAQGRLQEEVDQHRRTEQALHLSELRFEKAFQASPIPIAIFSWPSLQMVDANESLCRLTGWSIEEQVGRTPRALGWTGADKTEVAECMSRRETLRNWSGEIRTKSNAPRKVLMSSERFQQDDQEFVLVLLQNVSELEDLQAELHQAQKMEAVGQLAAGVAHDFNNILTIIQGHAQLRLASPGLDKAVHESFRQVADAAERAAALTRQLLAFSRKQVLQVKPMDLAALTERLGSLLRRLLGEHVQLEIDNAPNLPAIFADACNVEQIIVNLSVNARDAMPEGGTLSIRTRAVRVEPQVAKFQPNAVVGDYVCLCVADTGTGMDAATKARIFEPFFTTKEFGKGTGLGLATVDGIVKQHKGWIELDTQLGAGTSFRVFLPVAPAEDTAQTADSTAGAPLSFNPASKTILYAEDEPTLRGMLAEVLRQIGYRVLEAANGAEALDLWRSRKTEIDLLLTDMVMPGHLNGRRLYESLAAERPNLKVVFTSGYTGALVEVGTVLKEDINYLPKPHSPSALAAILARNLGETSGYA